MDDRMKKPDYSCNCSSFGHTKDSEKIATEIYGTNNAWEWPRFFSKRKRIIIITISKFFGDYHHWYSELKEEDNPFWLPPGQDYPKGCWIHDQFSRGQKFSERFNTEQGAKTYADLILREHFPKHKIIFKVGGKNKRWNYSKDGD